MKAAVLSSSSSSKLCEQNGVIYFPVLFKGATGTAWKERFPQEGVSVSNRAQQVLYSSDFTSTPVGVKIEIAILKSELFPDGYLTTTNIREQAHAGTLTGGRKLVNPTPDIACIIRCMFTNEAVRAMGLVSVCVMHDPIKDFNASPSILRVFCAGDVPWLDACYARSNEWERSTGFVFFLPPQVSSG